MEQEMKYIYAIYKTGSFSAAAKELFLTQPALSIAVSRAESRIGMPLFDRSARPLTLTAAGEAYIQKYKEIQQLEKELEQQLSDITDLKNGELRIGGSHYMIAHVLPPVLAAFTKKYPGIHLELTEAGADSLLQMLADHTIDLTFHCEEKAGDSFRRVPCFEDQLLLAVPQVEEIFPSITGSALSADDIRRGRHRLEDCPAVPLQMFRDMPFILLTPGNGLHNRSTAMFQEAEISPAVRLMTSQLATAWHLCEAGIGASFIPDRLIAEYTTSMAFFRIPSSHTVRTFDLTMSGRRYVSRAMQAFEELVTSSEFFSVPSCLQRQAAAFNPFLSIKVKASPQHLQNRCLPGR